MLLQLRGGWHVNHRGQHHQTIHPDALGVAGISYRARGREFGDAGNDRHFATDDFDGGTEHGALLVGAQRVVLPDCAQQDQAMHSIAHQRGLHGLRGGEIHLQVGVELSGGGGENPGPVTGEWRRHGAPRIRYDYIRC